MNTFMLNLTRSDVARYCAALTGALLVSCTSAPTDRREAIVLPATSPFPESVAASNDGTLFVSSITHGGVLKIAPGSSTPVTFVEPGEHGTRSTFGVFADDRRGTLWVASNDASVIGLKGPSTVEGAWIKGFDLTSGKLKSSFRLPAPAIANDIAIGADDALYVTNTVAPRILRIDPGAGSIDVFVQDDALKGGLDGIAFGADGHLYVNTFGTGELFRIEIRAGKAGKVTKLRTTRPLDHPDGLRSHQGGFMMVEGGGTLDRIKIDDDTANVETVAQVAGPTGLWLTRDKAWIAEGQLSYLTDPTKKGTLPASFRLRALPLPP